VRKGFSLLELLIVVVIVGLIYTLALNNLEQKSEIQEPVRLSNLKDFLQKIPHQKSVRFLCLDECKSCYILSDGEHLEEYDTLLDKLVDEDIEIYSYTMRNRFELQEKGIYFTDEREYENICFSYEVDATGRGEDIFVLSQGKVYDLSSNFSKNVYSSLEEAEAARSSFETKVMR
jgi:prepilin-type N-terminal cleavage/methylation domain-containing protein